MKADERSPDVYLEDILSAVSRIARYASRGREAFFADELVQDGIIRQLSIIGEAASKLPVALRQQHERIPWRTMIDMRNLMIHEYSAISLATVWDTVQRDLPALQQAVEAMVRGEGR